MNEEQRNRLAKLKIANAEYMKGIQWQNNPLLQECLAVLSSYRIVKNEQEIKDILCLANSNKIKIVHHSDNLLLDKTHNYYVVWDNAQVPIVECAGRSILENYDDVLAVAFDTCFVDVESKQAILVRG